MSVPALGNRMDNIFQVTGEKVFCLTWGCISRISAKPPDGVFTRRVCGSEIARTEHASSAQRTDNTFSVYQIPNTVGSHFATVRFKRF